MDGLDATLSDEDEAIIESASGAGYVVAFGGLLYRAHDAVLRLRKQGIDVGLVNKPTLNSSTLSTRRRSASFALRTSCSLSRVGT